MSPRLIQPLGPLDHGGGDRRPRLRPFPSARTLSDAVARLHAAERRFEWVTTEDLRTGKLRDVVRDAARQLEKARSDIQVMVSDRWIP